MLTQYRCRSRARRDLVGAARDENGRPFLNGLDFLELVAPDQLEVHFVHNVPGAADTPVPPPPAPELTAADFEIVHRPPAQPVRVIDVERTGDDVLRLTVDRTGEVSTYTLRLVTLEDGYDPQLTEIDFSFHPECADNFDCSEEVCLPAWTPPPDIHYLAKDYATFRQTMLDRLSALVPGWVERNAADLGVTLVELLAYVGDYLSYTQDAIATEAYLHTARSRVSVRRHARLVDYFMHDGRNARTWVQLRVRADRVQPDADHPVLPRGTQFLTRVAGQAPGPLSSDPALYRQALADGAVVFESMAPVAALYEAHNEMPFYTWGAADCCLPAGATRATLDGRYPNLAPGMVLIFQEVLGPRTGQPEDADPAHRHAVRLVEVITEDAKGRELVDPLNPFKRPEGQFITEIRWHEADALPFPLCLSSTTDEAHGQVLVTGVSVALGNVVLADHGRTLDESEELGVVPVSTMVRVPAAIPPALPGSMVAPLGEPRPVPPRFRPRLKEGPVTQAAPYPFETPADRKALLPARAGLSPEAAGQTMADVLPQVTLTGTLDTNVTIWEAARDLLRFGRLDRRFVVEVEADGSARLRFGDDVHGIRPIAETRFSASYRVGNGRAGNIGADALVHIRSQAAAVVDIIAVTNPLPAEGGIEPESSEEVRQRAPVAFRTQERAVTPEDYARMAERHPEVQRAAATRRWSGSWNTIFLTVDRRGGDPISAEFEAELREFLEPYRMAGHDLEIDSPRLVPLELALHVCAAPDYFRADIRAALLDIFNNRDLSNGRRGLFHPDNFTFGQTVYLSPFIAAAQAVPGVASVTATAFGRQGLASDEGLLSGELKMGRLEIPVLDNDPRFPDRGLFRLTVEGGK